MAKEKHLRVQGPRSQRGCIPCKSRHVKCDEVTPICGRCLKGGRICQYPDISPRTAISKVIIYMPKPMDVYSNLSPSDRRALDYFENRITSHIGGPFQSELWSTIIPQMTQRDEIVRHAVLALSAFHEQYTSQISSPSSESDLALSHYSKTLTKLSTLESHGLDKSFDTALCASIILSQCEGLRGEFRTANIHLVHGMRIIAERARFARGLSIFSSQKNILGDVFLTMQNSALESNVDDFATSFPSLQQLETMPDSFNSPDEAIPSFNIIANQIFELFFQADKYHQTNIWVPGHVSSHLRSDYEGASQRLEAWKSATRYLESSTLAKTDIAWMEKCYLLQIHFLGMSIDLYVFVHGEWTYDEFLPMNQIRLDLVESFLRLRSGSSDTSSSSASYAGTPSTLSGNVLFIWSPEIVPVLFEIATRTKVAALRDRAMDILRACRRREGTWDSSMAAALAEQLHQLKVEKSIEAALLSPPHKFLVTDVQLITTQLCEIKYGFKIIRPGTFESFWLETINEGDGILQSQELRFDSSMSW